MKIYKTNLSTKVFLITAFLGFIILWIGVILIEHQITLFEGAFFLLAFLMCIFGIYALFTTKIITNDEKIEHIAMFGRKSLKRSLFWNEIKEVDSAYFFLPEMIGWIALIPYKSSEKKPIGVLWTMISALVVKDILSHLSPTTKIYLYPYLKRKIENKQTLFYANTK